VGLVNNGYRLGMWPGKRLIGALSSIYNGGGHLHTFATTNSRQRANYSTFSGYSGMPIGNLHPRSWQLPQKSGAMSMRVLGEGDISANLIPSYPMSIDLTGSGDLEATGALVVSMLIAMTGSGSLAANIFGYYNMSVDFTGDGDLAANMEGIASMAIDMLGQGDLEATIAAYGNMEIDIVVTGTGLSTANVGQAVWDALATQFNNAGTMGELLNSAGAAADPLLGVVEGTLTLRDVQRIVLAVLAGQVTGAGSGTETFKGQGGEDRVVSTVDNDGNRSSVTLDAS